MPVLLKFGLLNPKGTATVGRTWKLLLPAAPATLIASLLAWGRANRKRR
jgi:hypothetical protein